MKPLHSIYITDPNKEYRLDIYKSDDFSNLDRIVQAYGILLNKDQDQVLIVKKNKRALVASRRNNRTRRDSDRNTYKRSFRRN